MKRKLPPLTALRSFESAARHSSFRDAAEELCVSHSAISHQIKQLEEYLGIALFERKPRAVELTRAGQLYYPQIRDSFDRISEATELLTSPEPQDTLTVQLYSTFAIRWLIPRLPAFNEKHPNIKVRLNTSQFDIDLEHDDVDLCVMIGAMTSVDLHYDYLFTSELFPVANPAFAGKFASKVTEQGVAALADAPLLQVYPSEKDWYVWLQGCGVEGVNPKAGQQFDSYDHALSAAVQGMGVALGMAPYIDRDFTAGLLVELFPGQRVKADGDWYLVCRQQRMEMPKVQIFREWLLEEIKQDGSLSSLRAGAVQEG